MRLRDGPIPAQIRKVRQWLGQHPPWMPRGYGNPLPTLPRKRGRVGRGRATAILCQETLSSYRVCLGDQSGAATAQDFGGQRAIYGALEPHRLAVEFRHGGTRCREAAFYSMHEK